MTILTTATIITSFCAGVVAGTFLNDYDIVTAEDIRKGVAFASGKIKSAVNTESQVDNSEDETIPLRPARSN